MNIPRLTNLSPLRRTLTLIALAIVLLLLLMLLATRTAGAQDHAFPRPDVNGPPTYGSVTLWSSAGALPYRRDMTSGGPINAFALFEEPGCAGHIARNPDFRLVWGNSGKHLAISFTADPTDFADTTLLIDGPNGIWYCDDDSGGALNPLALIENAPAGRYNIYVGSYTAGEAADGTLEIDEYRPYAPTGLDLRAAPTAGAHSVTNLPLAIDNITAGGATELNRALPQVGCRGFTSRAPAAQIDYRGRPGQLLTFNFVPQGETDTTLAVYGPYNTWWCGDDSDGALNPEVGVLNAQPGRYLVWVGTYLSDTSDSGTLTVRSQSVAGALQPDAPPQHGTVALAAGFTPDPHRMWVTAGGPVAVFEQPIGRFLCGGFASARPDVRLNWSGESGELRLFFVPVVANADTTIIVRAPNGEYYCNDDFDSLSPLVSIANPPAGEYTIWVGSFQPDNDRIQGQLYISELQLSPVDYLPQGDAPIME